MRNFSRDDRSGGRSSGGSRGGFGGGRSAGRDSGAVMMHSAHCDECGKSCEVPFRPTSGKPVLCSSCFQESKGERSERGERRDRGDRRESRDRGDRFGGREEKRMYKGTCDACGASCEVPFRPTGGKPLFCNNCFGKEDAGNFEARGSRGGIDMEALKEEIKAEMKEQFDALNAKLDRISRMLSPVVAAKDLPASAVVAEPDENDEEEIVIKKTERKKAAAK